MDAFSFQGSVTSVSSSNYIIIHNLDESTVGAPLAGRLSDYAIIKGRKRRGGEWVPEDRLISTLPGALIVVPISVLIFGITADFVPGRLGLVINLICLFMNGVGVSSFRLSCP